MQLQQQIESLLFIAGKPLTYKKMAAIIGGKAQPNAVRQAAEDLAGLYRSEDRGVQIVLNEDKAQMVTHPELSLLTQAFVKEDIQGELSKPSIETLAIICYRGPVAKLELERIRGINCSLILRNLLLRGLIEVKYDAKKHEDYYNVTLEFLKHLGVSSARELPDYEKLHLNKNIEAFLKGEA